MTKLCRSVVNTKKDYEKDQQPIKSFDEICSKSLQQYLIDRKENESLCNFSTTYVDETKSEYFIKMNIRGKIIFLFILN